MVDTAIGGERMEEYVRVCVYACMCAVEIDPITWYSMVWYGMRA